MMDHALRTVCFICDIGDILVLMSRRLTTDLPDVNIEEGNSNSLKNLLSEREKRTSKNICHIFQCEEVSYFFLIFSLNNQKRVWCLTIHSTYSLCSSRKTEIFIHFFSNVMSSEKPHSLITVISSHTICFSNWPVYRKVPNYEQKTLTYLMYNII